MFQRQAREPFPFRNILLLAAVVVAFLVWLFKSTAPQAPTPPESPRTPGVPPNEGLFAAREYPYFTPDMAQWSSVMAEMSQLAAERGPSGSLDAAWTVQGPGNIGARVNCIKVHPSNPNIIYIGYSNAGVWKTTNGGQSWFPVFDQQPLLVIGDIELDPQDPNTVYVGTGDPNVGGYASIGNGLWKSTNGGVSWTYIGLENTRIISKIIIHPQNSNIIYAATMGLPFQRNNDRGVYKTVNGGQTWQQVLFIDQETGFSDLEMSPSDPNVLYASSWVRIRTNSESLVAGANSGVWKTGNGGQNWQRQTAGLPTDKKSRVSLTVDAQQPNRVLAMYADSTLDFHNIYETTNAGASWQPTLNNDLDYGFQGGFAWYFGCIEINPFDPDDVWAGGVEMWRSLDRGTSWFMTTPDWWLYEVHADMHDVAFVSANEVLLATDGGLYRSEDSGFSWQKIENIPATQFYRVAYNPHSPAEYFGGAQDNGTTGGNASFINEWPRLYGGDGFQAVFHPTDPEIYYYEIQNGFIVGHTSAGFNAGFSGESDEDRRSWDMPYMISRQNPEKMYAGTYRIHLGEGHIPFWVAASEDLTDGVIFGSSYHVITALDEDYFTQNQIYVGTSDANVWKGDPSNFSWTNISAGLPNRYVSSVHPSPHVANRVFVTQTGYRDNDFSSHIHRSDDGGLTWTSVAGDLPAVSVNDLAVIPGRADSVLCAATDWGVFITLDAGQHWVRLGSGMPPVRVFDLDINPSERTLMAGTFARSIMTFPLDSMVLDPISSTRPVAQAHEIRIFPGIAASGTPIQVVTAGLPAGWSPVLELYDLNGRRLLHQPLNGQPIPLPTLPAGVIVASVSANGQVLKAQKIVVRS